MRRRCLDVSSLLPPEPLERALAALESLAADEYLCLCHRREPVLLYPQLDVLGFRYRTRPGARTAYEVLIWHQGAPAPQE